MKKRKSGLWKVAPHGKAACLAAGRQAFPQGLENTVRPVCPPGVFHTSHSPCCYGYRRNTPSKKMDMVS